MKTKELEKIFVQFVWLFVCSHVRVSDPVVINWLLQNELNSDVARPLLQNKFVVGTGKTRNMYRVFFQEEKPFTTATTLYLRHAR